MRPRQLLHSLFFLVFFGLGVVNAAVTVYYPPGQEPLGVSGTSSAAAADYTGAAAYNPTILIEPPIPNPAIPREFVIQLQNGGTPGASIPQAGCFFGFSIEFSVVNQVLGRNASFIQVPFLNLMANIQQRAGRVLIRVGGNTQETAVLVPSLADGRMLEKDLIGTSNPTLTPPVVYTPEVFYLMRNISNLINIRWFMGIPFNDTTNFRLGIAEQGQAILGEFLIGLQAGNEPDLYARHQRRPATYTVFDYIGEFQNMLTAMSGEAHARNRNILLGPSIATGDWTPELVWDTGFVDTFNANLAILTVEHYPTDNCFAQFGVGTNRSAQDMFPTFLNHTSGQNIVRPYLNSTAYAQTKGKPLIMFETNTASCGGFPGISDSFGAALWALDYGLQMAHSNFSGAMLHVGGQNVFYNPFTSPPTNQSTFRQWTIGPVYYSALIMAEALGASNASQVLDLNANAANIFTPAYAIYEGGNPVRVALFNYITDPSGGSEITATISIGGGQTGQPNATPPQVKVKYLAASSVSQKGNFTWAGQTFGGHFESDGRLKGTEDIQTVTCDPNANACKIKVPAPGFALVFLNDQAFTESGGAASTTFATSARTKTQNTATVDASVLATSNGHSGMNAQVGSTSRGRNGNGVVGVREMLPSVLMLGALISGAMVVGRALVR